MRTLLLLLGVLAVAATVTAAATAAPPRLEAPRTSRLAYAGTILNTDAVARPAAIRSIRSTAWGGQRTAATGETVNVVVSNSYPLDDAIPQKWADFVASLVHGPEIAQMTLLLVTPAELPNTCGTNALACYDPRESLLVAPGETITGTPPIESIVAHEYGHNVAAHRANNPWPAVDWGTKRWATYEQICTRTGQGGVYPGNESSYYRLNPGEAFAETYRVLNERKLGLPETPWELVDPVFAPDDGALAAVEQDVVSPWTGAILKRIRVATRTRVVTLSTPLDGTVRASITGNATSVEIVAPTETRRARGKTAATATVCGARTVRVRVTRPAGAGAATLTLSRP